MFQLAAGYMQDDGRWTKEFEVRELTGRDEEAMARIPDIGRSLAAMFDAEPFVWAARPVLIAARWTA